MAFNRRNLYKRIIEVQEVALPEWERGVPFSVIYHRYIKKRFHISERTFNAYLGVPAKRKLKEMDGDASLFSEQTKQQNTKEKQMDLFDNTENNS